MNMKNFSISAGIVLALAACSQAPREPEEIVAERAEARWEAMVARDFEAAWDYYSPGFRGQSDKAEFRVDMSRRPIRWDSAEVTGVSCEDQRCSVTVQVAYTATGAPGVMAGMNGNREVTETWLQIDGQWWYSRS